MGLSTPLDKYLNPSSGIVNPLRWISESLPWDCKPPQHGHLNPSSGIINGMDGYLNPSSGIVNPLDGYEIPPVES